MPIDLPNLISKGESDTLELKSSFNDGVIESLVAFANAKGGRVLIGIDEHGQINTNFKLGKESLQNWINEIRNKTQPIIVPDVALIEEERGNIVALTIQEHPIKPVSFKGRYYIRIRNANQLLNAAEITDLQLKSLNTSFDAILQPSKPEDLNIDLIGAFLEKVKQTGRYQVLPSPLANLEKLRFTIHQQPT